MQQLVFPINALPSCQLIRGDINDILWKAEVKFEALQRYYEKIEADVLFYFSDIVIQAEAMGARVKYSRTGMPAVQSPARVVLDAEPAEMPRMRVNSRVVERMAKEFPGKLRAALVYGPFTVAGQVVGEEKILRGLVEDPHKVLAVLEKTFATAKRYARYLMDSGANLLWVSDPLAALIPPAQFRRFAGHFLKELFDLFAAVPTILHICGDTHQIITEMVGTGVRGISFDNCMDLLAVEDDMPDEVSLIGNIDPVEVIELGLPGEVVSRTAELVNVMAMKDNFVLSTGCAVPCSAPLENIRLFVETGRKSWADLAADIPLLSKIGRAVYAGDGEATEQRVTAALRAGIEPLTVITSGLTRGVRKGSAMYEVRRCYLPAILLMVDAFYQGFRLLEPGLEPQGPQKPAILIGTVRGDIHEIGKNLVRIFLETHGHKVVDLGVDVDANTFIEAYQQYRPMIIGLSAFTTPAKKEMKKVIQDFHKQGIREVLFIVGGAAVSNEVSRSVGADGYARDAVRAVKLVEKLLGGRAPSRAPIRSQALRLASADD